MLPDNVQVEISHVCVITPGACDSCTKGTDVCRGCPTPHVWLLPNESPEIFIVQHMWTFSANVATRANMEGRIVMAKLGTMSVWELEGLSLPSPDPSIQQLTYLAKRGCVGSIDRLLHARGFLWFAPV